VKTDTLQKYKTNYKKEKVMTTDASKKVEFIVAWYNKEKIRFSFGKQIMLAKTWIDICTRSEEYEMAAALQKEKEKVIKKHLQDKRDSRTWKQRVKYFWIKLTRKIKR
jgi:hypothetical protein